jgi:four helix bundle protein
MKQYSFEKLIVWQEARVLVKSIYAITRTFPKEEIFGITSQMRRAAISICSNIAEGSGRTTKPDQAKFYKIAYSSLLELLNQLIISSDLTFITDSELTELREKIDSIAYKITSLRNSL